MVDKQYLAGKTGEELKELVAQYGSPALLLLKSPHGFIATV